MDPHVFVIEPRPNLELNPTDSNLDSLIFYLDVTDELLR